MACLPAVNAKSMSRQAGLSQTDSLSRRKPRDSRELPQQKGCRGIFFFFKC